MVESGIGQDSDIRASFEAINHLKYGTENQEYAFIQSFFKETGYGNDSKIHENFEALYQNIDETKLIEELQNYGFRFEYALDEEGSHYVLISVDK